MVKGKLITALVPMKDHSERVPNKNLRPLCGQPLCHWIIRSLKNSKYIKDIVVNTDSTAIAEDIRQNFEGAMILVRPEDIRGDFVTMNVIIAYDLSQIPGDHFLQTHSTNPLLTTGNIDECIEFYLNNLALYDSLFTVTRHNARFYWQDGRPLNHDPQQMLRTQDLPPIYEENSNLYLFSRESFRLSGNRRIGLKPYMMEIDKREAVDIDEEQDFVMADMLLRSRLNNIGKDPL